RRGLPPRGSGATARDRPTASSGRTPPSSSPNHLLETNDELAVLGHVLDSERVDHGLKDASQRELTGGRRRTLKRLGERACPQRSDAGAHAVLRHVEGERDGILRSRLE